MTASFSCHTIILFAFCRCCCCCFDCYKRTASHECVVYFKTDISQQYITKCYTYILAYGSCYISYSVPSDRVWKWEWYFSCKIIVTRSNIYKIQFFYRATGTLLSIMVKRDRNTKIYICLLGQEHFFSRYCIIKISELIIARLI